MYFIWNIYFLGSRIRKGYCFLDKRRYKIEAKLVGFLFGWGVKGKMGRSIKLENIEFGKIIFGKFKIYGRWISIG